MTKLLHLLDHAVQIDPQSVTNPVLDKTDMAQVDGSFHLGYSAHVEILKQANRKVLVSSTMHRTFGRPQCLHLRDLLVAWKTNLSGVQDGMKNVIFARMELAAKTKAPVVH
ncbi:hypothetical protein QAD02_002337 [Eretmocerus hayati]|uniref:Uncharacterized protein n=1 Tax=Eretmocerus hayati TaxID=131215 RepID=A0ACC2NIR3_9HYME|nr:hypothetical protein QAD02_002337 [Eretmocerus hayati]